MPSVTAHTAHTILVAPLMLPVCVLFVLAPTVRLVPVLTLSSVSIVRTVQYTTHVLLSSLMKSEPPSHSTTYFISEEDLLKNLGHQPTGLTGAPQEALCWHQRSGVQ